ncbi:MAG: igiC [Henriciella sp.]
MNKDVLGTRALFGVLGPSTNTIVQPEFDAMRPVGITNHYSRIHTPNAKAVSNATFLAGAKAIAENVDEAVERVLTCEPNYLVMGMSAVTFFGGAKGADEYRDHVASISGLGVSTGALACIAALEAYGGCKKLAVVSPYFPAMNAEVSGFFSDHGYEVVRDRALECPSWVDIARVPEDRLRDVICNELNGDDVDAIIQVGTNLCMTRFAAEAERWLDKPVIAINTATYWHALRTCGFDDKVQGFGRLLTDF